MILSTKSKEGIKTGLGIVIAFAIAMSLGWENPYWAALAVAAISLDTTGQSMNKGRRKNKISQNDVAKKCEL